MIAYAVALADVQQLLSRIREQDEAILKLQADITEKALLLVEKDRLIAELKRTIEVLTALVEDLQDVPYTHENNLTIFK